jgi:hypothetical protein
VGAKAVVGAAAAELSADNELPIPSSWVAAPAIAAGAVLTYAMCLSWWKVAGPNGSATVVSVSECWNPASGPRVYLGVT